MTESSPGSNSAGSAAWRLLGSLMAAVLVVPDLCNTTDARFERWFSRHSFARLLLLAPIAAAAAWMLLAPLLDTGPSMADEWRYAEWKLLNPDFRFADGFQVVRRDGSLTIGQTDRFQPAMWLVNIAEQVLWNDDAAPRRWMRLLWMSVFALAVLETATALLGLLAGVALLTLIVNLNFWLNLWFWSSYAAEQIALLGLAFFIFGTNRALARIVNDRRTLGPPLILIGLGAALAINAKENFVFMAVPTTLMAGYALVTRRAGILGLLAAAVAIASAVLLIVAIWLGPVANGQDTYGNPIGLTIRALAVLHWRYTPWAVAVGSVLFLGYLGLGYAARNHRDAARVRRAAGVGAVTMTICFGWLAWEVAFYIGRLPVANRYDFPAMLILPIALGAAIHLFLSWSQVIGGWSHRGWLGLCLLIAVLTAPGVSFPLNARQAGRAVADSIRQRSADLIETARLAKENPTAPIIVQWQPIYGYEYALTAPIWLRWSGVSNPITLMVEERAAAGAQGYYRGRVDQMLTIVRAGSPEYLPLDSLRPAIASGNCFVVGIGFPLNRDSLSATGCRILPFLPYSYAPPSTGG